MSTNNELLSTDMPFTPEIQKPLPISPRPFFKEDPSLVLPPDHHTFNNPSILSSPDNIKDSSLLSSDHFFKDPSLILPPHRFLDDPFLILPSRPFLKDPSLLTVNEYSHSPDIMIYPIHPRFPVSNDILSLFMQLNPLHQKLVVAIIFIGFIKIIVSIIMYLEDFLSTYIYSHIFSHNGIIVVASNAAGTATSNSGPAETASYSTIKRKSAFISMVLNSTSGDAGEDGEDEDDRKKRQKPLPTDKVAFDYTLDLIVRILKTMVARLQGGLLSPCKDLNKFKLQYFRKSLKSLMKHADTFKELDNKISPKLNDFLSNSEKSDYERLSQELNN
jgi:hypothetical protein